LNDEQQQLLDEFLRDERAAASGVGAGNKAVPS
jgi:hypothetical protein